MLDPIGHIFERSGLEARWSPLSVASARDQARVLEHSQMPGHRRHAHPERLRKRCNGGLASHCQLGENRAPGWVGESVEHGRKAIGGHGHLMDWLINLLVK